ncbi:MAG: cyclodeaminase/cyclohydrolase family protein [Candidatus Adiutrix sp.]|jgi:formiminotetrahydrofolate cyclodeaminase|nr:cyclodeaminase/cyclohydrolase family protein [Candidatus Adiutrix sp.]
MLVKSTVEEFNKILGSNSPAPGGGSVSALSGALGAELLSMVCNLSLGKADLSEWQPQLNDTLDRVQALAASLLKRVDLDTGAFNRVMAAFKMPKGSEEEKKARSAAILAGYQEAAQSPLGIAGECLEVLRLADRLTGRFNPNALSDFGVAALEALTGLEGAVMNVRINLPSIKDEKFVAETMAKVADMITEGRVLKDKICDYVKVNLG